MSRLRVAVLFKWRLQWTRGQNRRVTSGVEAFHVRVAVPVLSELQRESILETVANCIRLRRTDIAHFDWHIDAKVMISMGESSLCLYRQKKHQKLHLGSTDGNAKVGTY